jgi:hypothetical protein
MSEEEQESKDLVPSQPQEIQEAQKATAEDIRNAINGPVARSRNKPRIKLFVPHNVVLPDVEDERMFKDFANAVRTVYVAENAFEEYLVGRIILLMWQLNRAEILENMVLIRTDNPKASAYQKALADLASRIGDLTTISEYTKSKENMLMRALLQWRSRKDFDGIFHL